MTTARKTLWLALVVLLVALGIAGVRIGEDLSGGGLQPTALIPADVVAAASLDLDPALDQKLAIRALADHFPSTKGSSDSELRLKGVQLALPGCVSVKRDIASWFGLRIALAVPDTARPSLPTAVIQIRNHKIHTARAAAKRIETCTKGRLRLGIRDHFMLMSPDPTQLTRMMALPRAESLNRDATYERDIHSLHGNQIATVWGDGTKARALLDAIVADVPGASILSRLIPKLSGRAVMGIHATGSTVELQLLTPERLAPRAPAAGESHAGPEDLRTAPATSMAALYSMPATAPEVDAAISAYVPKVLRGGGVLSALLGIPKVTVHRNPDSSIVVSLGPTSTEDPGLRAKALGTIVGYPAVVAFIRPATIPGAPRSLAPIKAIGLVVTRSGATILRIVV